MKGRKVAEPVLNDGFVRLCITDEANVAREGCKILIEGAAILGSAVPPTVTILAPNMTVEQVSGTESLKKRGKREAIKADEKMLAAVARKKGTAKKDVVIPIVSDRDIDNLFGAGSVLSESLRVAMCTCPSASFYALPRVPGANATFATIDMTITGTAETAGRFQLYMGEGDWIIDLPVARGDTAAQIGNNLVAEINDLVSFPYAATSAQAGTTITITFTALNAGTVGNDLTIKYNPYGRDALMAKGISVSTPGQFPEDKGIDDPADQFEYASLGDCCYDCIILADGNPTHQDALDKYLKDAWDCKEGQCFGSGYTYANGTDADEIISEYFTNAETLSKIPLKNGKTNILGYLQAAAYGARSCCEACDRPELSIQGRVNGLLSCLRQPQSCESVFTADEKQKLKDNGFSIVSPVGQGIGGLTNLFVENDVTNNLYDANGRLNTTWQSTNSRRMAKKVAILLAEELQKYNGLSLYTKSTAIREGTQGITVPMLKGLLRNWAKNQVGILFSEFDDIDNQIVVQTEAETLPNCAGKPGRIVVFFSYRMPERLSLIMVDVKPRLMDPCAR